MHEKFAEQMHLIQHATENEVEELHDYPKTEQYLSFVGVDEDVIQVSTSSFFVNFPFYSRIQFLLTLKCL